MKEKLEGRWISSCPTDSDDYLVEYFIKIVDGEFQIIARDLQDNEEMLISDVSWDGDSLKFRSIMPSTDRVGFNIFRLLNDDEIEAKFTFTVLEVLKRG